MKMIVFERMTNQSICDEKEISKKTRGGTGLGPSPTRSRPSRFFELLRVFEPEVFESGLGPTWREPVKPEPERKSRGYLRLPVKKTQSPSPPELKLHKRA